MKYLKKLFKVFDYTVIMVAIICVAIMVYSSVFLGGISVNIPTVMLIVVSWLISLSPRFSKE